MKEFNILMADILNFENFLDDCPKIKFQPGTLRLDCGQLTVRKVTLSVDCNEKHGKTL